MSGPNAQPLPIVATRPPIELTARPSLGELVVVPPKRSPAQVYERTLDLIASTRKEIASVTTTKGPNAVVGAKDAWLRRNDWVVGLSLLTAAGTGLTAFLNAMVSTGSATVAAGAAVACAGAAALGLHAARTEERIQAATTRHAGEVFDSSDLERMTATLRGATPEERAMVAGFVTGALAPLDEAMSAQAATRRERLLADLPALDEATKRAATLAIIVDELRNGASLVSRLDTIRSLLDAAAPAERIELAAKLDAGALDDEKPFVGATREQIRELIKVIGAAQRGESAPAAEA